MLFFPPPLSVPPRLERQYRLLRTLLYLLIATITVIFALRVLFPTLVQSFDFRSPDASRNNLFLPHAPDGTSRSNGKIESKGTLLAHTAVLGNFSEVTVTVRPERDSVFPETLSVSLRRSYQSFLFPTGEPVGNFPQETLYRVDGNYYAFREGTLYPFVSEAAYRSRFPESRATSTDTSLLSRYPVSETWLGFRVGSLLSNATGVFVVTSETEVRPVGSAEIFLGLGYNFSDVIPVSEEELGVYTRGRILLLGAAHPDGTLLYDRDQDQYFLVDQGTKRLLLPGAYRDFLLTNVTPILVSSKESTQSAGCTLLPNVLSTTLSCSTAITTLASGFGNDFEVQLYNPEADLDINTLSVSFETAKNKQNLFTLLSQIKQRLLARFGGA